MKKMVAVRNSNHRAWLEIFDANAARSVSFAVIFVELLRRFFVLDLD
jgi:hypothetical protein